MATKKTKSQSGEKPAAHSGRTSKRAPVADKTTAAGYPIVGIGASAGGLEAFEAFFGHVKPDSGMAYVLVPHLDPSHPSLLSEILQRITTLPVVEAMDQVAILPDHVYVIPPNRNMAVLQGKLQLSVPDEPRGMRMPIDFFMRSLADEKGDAAVGIVLSGTGTDGTLGLRAIQGAGGVCLVQEPSTAKYDGMPQSVIQAGYATHVLSVESMPKMLQDVTRQRLVLPSGLPTENRAVLNSMNQIMLLLRSGTGHDFSQYKKSTLGRRIERRMSQQGIEDIAVYARYLKENPIELQILFKELLINVTSFFRDPEAFATLKQDVLPQLLADKPEDYNLRIWVAGCATGEEAYSIAIVVRELMVERWQGLKVQIYATDLAETAITTARAGRYPPNIAQDILPDRLQRFFLKEDDGYYRVKKEIREMVVFAVQSVIKDPPFTKLDLLSCRNLMIYLEPDLQNRLILNFHCALKPGGVLFLSASENITQHAELFAPINRRWKFFRAVHSLASGRTLLSGNVTGWFASADSRLPDIAVAAKPKQLNVADLTNRLLLQTYAPASVLTDLQGNILYVHGETGRYLRPPPGQATLSVVEMAREGLRDVLRTAILAAVAEGEPTISREVPVKTNGHATQVSFSVRTLPIPNSSERMLLISFQDVPVLPKSKGRAREATPEERTHEALRNEELERELSYSRQNLQATIAEQQATNEELKSANEEMQSTNEELQSTNEELETSREELQSLNEELITVNAELQSKIEQLSGVQSDMKNLLDNVNVATIFLDEHMRIRRFTRDAGSIYRLVASDIGRSLNDIKSNLTGDNLLVKAQVVLDTLVPYESELQTDKGIFYLARIQPYRTLDNVIDGVVLTFTDISKRVAAEHVMRLARQAAEGIVDTVREPLVVLDGNLNVVLASHAFYTTFAVKPQETVGHRFYDLGEHQWDIPKLRELLENILPRDQAFEGYVVENEFPNVGRKKLLLNARRIQSHTDDARLILLAMEVAPNDNRSGKQA